MSSQFLREQAQFKKQLESIAQTLTSVSALLVDFSERVKLLEARKTLTLKDKDGRKSPHSSD